LHANVEGHVDSRDVSMHPGLGNAGPRSRSLSRDVRYFKGGVFLLLLHEGAKMESHA
jgi:hypothetical protein